MIIGVSACLLAGGYRYDGGDAQDERLEAALGAAATLVAVCPEVELGLPVPRERIVLTRTRAGLRLLGEGTRRDLTDEMDGFAAARLEELARRGLVGFVLKGRSPSCGLGGVVLQDELAGTSGREGVGLFAAALVARLPTLPVAEAERLQADGELDAFLRRVRTYARQL